ncbi:hypothetical protein GCM10009116_16440 [Brevundimonas basaltis]|uniref:Uncharacterized protein n=1 Tax=Brevundimonas basaltis TaxID=472166 RepID=A0A7W8MGJ9_9CAUL|nr:FxLYD domain-containing protein [Brevundimonas basaltis]MBB5291046.1 hypothetical protein [Brevundimonas basaltis]
MANTAEIVGDRRGWVAPFAPVSSRAAISSPILALRIGGDRNGVALTRNEVVREALGGRTWRGALTNIASTPRTAVSVEIHFHDRSGRVVGAPVSARVGGLDPGAAIHLQARLPAEAAGLSVHALRWADGGRRVTLERPEPLPFGCLPD